MDINQQLSNPDFDSNAFLRQLLKKGDLSMPLQDSIQDKLKVINSLSFKLQMSLSESLHLLSQNNSTVLQTLPDLKSPDASQASLPPPKDTKKYTKLKEDFKQLHQTEIRIQKCKSLSQEIEHFENRISKLEEYIRQDKFEELTELITQIQESLRVVRDLSFFERQKQRIEKFDKLIESYMQDKERELVFESEFYKREAPKIRCLLQLERYFKKDEDFVQALIKSKLMKEFAVLLQKEDDQDRQNKFFPKFSKALVLLLSNQKQFFDQLFPEQPSQGKWMYEMLLAQILQDYQEQAIVEFVQQTFLEQQVEVFEGQYIHLYQKVKEICPPETSFDSSFHPFFLQLYQGLFQSYKQRLDNLTSQAIEHLTDKDTITGWEKSLQNITQTIQLLLMNQIEISQCFELGSLILACLKSLEKFLMQLCYLIGQLCNKKIHLGIQNPCSGGQLLIDDQQYFAFENKFRWQNVFDLIQLHFVLMEFFDDVKGMDKVISPSLEKVAQQFEPKHPTPQKQISAYIASKNSSYFKYLQKAMNPGKMSTLFQKEAQANSTLESKVFKSELLQEAIKNNLLKTFIMPIFKELNAISSFPIWSMSGSTIPSNPKAWPVLPEHSEYMRKVGEHFISFIHKLDASSVASLTQEKQLLYQRYAGEGDSCGDYWIQQIGQFLLQVLCHKFKKIILLSQEGEKQLLSDITYFKKLAAQFFSAPSGTTRDIDSILCALVLCSFPPSNPTVKNILQDKKAEDGLMEFFKQQEYKQRLEALVGTELAAGVDVEEAAVRAVLQKRKS